MFFFKEKVCVYKVKGNKKEWKALRAALKEAGIKAAAHTFEDEMPVCGCGGRMDVRDFGPNGKIDRAVYDVCVLPEEKAKAEAIRDRLVTDYKEYVKE